MLRTLLTWRWVALTAVLVASVVAMSWLGQWQWGRSAPDSTLPVEDPATVDVASLPRVQDLVGVGDLPLQRDPGRLVRVEGEWVPERTLLVADREGEGDRAGEPGRWVVTPVRLGAPADGVDDVLVPVVRGWVPADPQDPAGDVPPPADATGPVQVVGWLQAPEPLDLPVDILQPAGVVPLLATADLVNRWPEEVVGAFVVAAPTAGPGGEAGAAAGQPVPLAAPPERARVTRDWRNLAYALQWFVFAGFAVVLWGRMLRDDVARQEAAAEAAALERVGAQPTGPPVPSERSAP